MCTISCMDVLLIIIMHSFDFNALTVICTREMYTNLCTNFVLHCVMCVHHNMYTQFRMILNLEHESRQITGDTTHEQNNIFKLSLEIIFKTKKLRRT